MGRLVEYMAELAAMLGERDNVHFVELREGSAQLVHAIEREAYPKVSARTRAIATGEAADDAMAAYHNLNKKLAQDNASATYKRVEGGAEILPFPGARAPKPVDFLPIEQPGSIDGIIIGIGGRKTGKNMVPIVVDAGETIISCMATRMHVKQLSPYLFDAQRRFHGTGHWHRRSDGIWALKHFQIQSHEELDDTPLIDIVRRLRAIPSELDRSDNPLTDIMRDRGEGDLN